jgi:hypothetical protein
MCVDCVLASPRIAQVDPGDEPLFEVALSHCTSCPLFRSDLKASAVEIKDLKHKLDHSSRYIVLSPPCETCVSLKGKLFYSIKENIELKQKVAYLSSRLERTILSEKMIE